MSEENLFFKAREELQSSGSVEEDDAVTTIGMKITLMDTTTKDLREEVEPKVLFGQPFL